jgi:UDP-GlcNAc3NAcA epimerase
MTTIVTVVGARPQFVKAAAVSRVLRAQPGVREILVHTGQHYDENMSGVFFEELEIPRPDYQLAVGSGKHGEQTGKMLTAIEQVLLDVKPDWMLVYGDTNSTLAGGVAAAKLNVPIAHVEAGLRSFNRRMPEEINRVLVDHVSDLLLAPTKAAVQNLQNEGIAKDKIDLVGDVMFDAAIFYGSRLGAAGGVLDRIGATSKNYVLSTIHRAENTDDPRRLEAIVAALGTLSEKLPVVLPLHPRTVGSLRKAGLSDKLSSRVKIIDPVGYLEMIVLEKNAQLIVTDSGGVQKEAFFQSVPCVTMRDETEWVELVETGWNRLAPPTDAATLGRSLLKALDDSATPPRHCSLYGGGRSVERIVARLVGPAQSITKAA